MSTTPRRGGRRSPVRIVHLGLGAFHRAHQAWFTSHADPDNEWGIAAFTGRTPEAADLLAAQDCVYTLVTRSAEGDNVETVESIVAAHGGDDTDALRSYLTDPEVSVVTLTVTEKGYRLDSDGQLDANHPDVALDLAVLREAFATRTGIANGVLRTMPGRLAWGLDARRRFTPSTPLSLIPCDNLSDNGQVASASVRAMAAATEPSLADWIDEYVDFVSTSVDRITPRTSAADIDATARRTGVHDPALVVTEPFHSWILSGRIRGDRPRWEDAGAVFVDDIGPFEKRKLWMLNGAHSLLAYEGIGRGHTTVAEAICDPVCAGLVEALWELDDRVLTDSSSEVDLDVTVYRAALLDRFRNPAIEHQLRQIAMDGSVKLPERIAEVVRRDLVTGGHAEAGLAALSAWIRFVLAETQAGQLIEDTAADEIAAQASSADPVFGLLDILSPQLAGNPVVLSRVAALCDTTTRETDSQTALG